ncbi:cell division protein FtsW [Candidatus Gottesmanbacteria bacterium]|nr:cell division protein FtsW [Candidatus Gottesmanbacteria bacterium]
MIRQSSPFKLFKQKKQFDYWILTFAILFSLFGILMIFESSNVIAFKQFGDKYYFIKEQLKWFGLGLIGLIVTSFISYKRFYNWSFPLLILTIISLLMVFIPGVGIKTLGASRWLNIGFIKFQPSEMAKLVIIFYLSAWFSNKETSRLLPFLLLISLVVGLVVIQPDLGTAIILTFIAIILYFLSGAKIWHFLMLIPAILFSVLGLIITSVYRFRRFTTFLNPNSDPLGASYHIRQILISLGSGGFWGLGLGSSRQKYQYLPEASTDSIFAIVGEELGFIGSAVLIILIIFFLYRLFLIARKAQDRYGFLMASGIFAFFASQMLINLGAIVALFPLTGVPLPFISYGGSNLVVSLTVVGIILNISLNQNQKS